MVLYVHVQTSAQCIIYFRIPPTEPEKQGKPGKVRGFSENVQKNCVFKTQKKRMDGFFSLVRFNEYSLFVY